VANDRRSISVADLRQERIVYGRWCTSRLCCLHGGAADRARSVKGILEVVIAAAPQNEDWRSLLRRWPAGGDCRDNATLFEDLQQSHTELTRAYDSTIEGWAHALTCATGRPRA